MARLTAGFGPGDPPDAPLDEQVEILRTGFISVEAVFERVLKMVEAEELGTSRVGPIQERAVVSSIRHDKHPFQRRATASTPDTPRVFIGRRAAEA